MSAAASQSIQEFTGTWRYKLGFLMIVVGNLGIVVAMLLPFVGVAAGTVGALVVGGEIVSLASIVFLGKEGFTAIKSKFLAFLKSSYAGPVGQVRHYIGIALLCTNGITTMILGLYLWNAFDATTPQDPIPVIWGLDFAQQGNLVLTLFLIGEFSFVLALYVLGADWWERFRKIFVWEGSAP